MKIANGVRIIVVFLTLLVTSPTVWAGAWTVPRNRWYTEYFARYFGSKKTFDERRDTSRRVKADVFRDLRSEWKAEYGLTDSLNFLMSVPYQSSHSRDDSVDLLTTGVGDIHLRVKTRFLEEPIVSSLQFSGKIPSAYNPNESPALGDGQVDFESRLLFSRAFNYSPYQVPVRRKARSAPPAPRTAVVTPAAQEEAVREQIIEDTLLAREKAIREAVLVSTLYERGRRLLYEGSTREASKWLRAVLESDSPHDEAMRLLDELMPQAYAESAPQPQMASVEGVDALPELLEPALLETETRYARVAFVNLEAGFTARNEEPANEFPLFFEAGFTPLKRLMLVGSVESVLSVKSTGELPEDFSKWGLRGIWNLWGDGFTSVFREGGGATVNVEVGYNDIFAGRNTADAFEVFGKIGIFF